MLDVAHLRLTAQGYAAIVGNIFGELPRSYFDGTAEIASPQKRNHCTAGVPSARIIDYWLQAITYFDPVFALVGGNQQEDAAILVFTPDAKLLIKVHRIILDALPLERMHRNNRHLRAGFLLKLSTQRFQSGLGVRLDSAGEVGDIAGRMNLLEVFGGRRTSKCKHQTKQCDET